MARLKLYLSYDGTKFRGWQRQKNTPHTIQEVFENKLSIIANSRVSLMASGRTDAGVHARVQVAHVDVPETTLRLLQPSPLSMITGHAETRLQQSLNSLLPPDIRLLRVEQVDADFHALKSAKKKTYVYFFNPNPVQPADLRNYTWHLKLPINWDAVEEATKYFVGRHDFKSFCAADAPAKSTVRTIYEARWGIVRRQGIGAPCDLRVLRVTGGGFLKHMVRCIAGSLIFVGQGKDSPDFIERALKATDRRAAGPTAPPHALWLWDILY